MSELYDKLIPHMEKGMALGTALGMLQWDNETLAPEESMQYMAKVLGILSGEYYKTTVNDDVKALLKELSVKEENDKLDFNQKAIVKKLKKDFDIMETIPEEEYRAYNELVANASNIWSKAKNENDFKYFAPTLEKIISYQKKFASYRQKDGKALYDILLDDYEEGFNMKLLDEFFGKIRKEIVPLLSEVVKHNDTIDKSFNSLEYDTEKQKEFGHFLAEYVGFDFKKGVLAESEHPFTMEFHNHDVRITTHYYKNNLESSIFSVIHESGHALYEMGVEDALTQTPVGGGTSMGMHESQSRFYENVLGRSKEFWMPLWDKLVNTFPEQLKGVTLERFIRCINKAEPDFIRTEADELTYSLHIMIRYEIEKLIFGSDIPIEELPALWNQKYQEYLGVTPPTDTLGILQDVHWSGGMFGYFPSYAIGSAVAAQLSHTMKEKMPVADYLKEGNLVPIREYLKDNIHKWGASKNTNELLLATTGESLNADYFIAYLKEKYK